MQHLRDRMKTFKGSAPVPRNVGLEHLYVARINDSAFVTWSILLAVSAIVLLGMVL